MADVDIKGIDKVALVQALYNCAQPLGLGYPHYTPEPLTQEEAEDLADTPWLDYVRRRLMKRSVAGDTMRTDLYNRDNGQGAAEQIIEAVRSRKAVAR